MIALSLPANSSCRRFPIDFVQLAEFIFAQPESRSGDIFLEMFY